MATLLSSPQPREIYALVTAGALRLLLPQEEVGEAEYLDGALCASEAFGLLKQRDTESARRYVALSEHMELLPQCPPGRFMVTSIGEAEDHLGWVWDELQILSSPKFSLEPIPPVLLAPDTPFTHFAELHGKLAYLCSARQLRAAVLGQPGG